MGVKKNKLHFLISTNTEGKILWVCYTWNTLLQIAIYSGSVFSIQGGFISQESLGIVRRYFLVVTREEVAGIQWVEPLLNIAQGTASLSLNRESPTHFP